MSEIQKTCGLALGGGAARGYAHIGVIQRIEELSISISAISGTSIGSIIAALYAFGYTSTEMQKIASEINIVKLLDLDLTHGLLKGKKIEKKLTEFFGGLKIENAKIPLSIVATDIDTGEKKVFRTGRVVDAIRASVSIPSLFSPYEFDGQNLVDGGLTENLPITVLPEGLDVIAVSVQMDLRRKAHKKPVFLFPDGNVFTNSYSIIRKTIAIMIAQNEKASLASRKNITLIRPGREDIEYYDFPQYDELIRAWYEAATISLT